MIESIIEKFKLLRLKTCADNILQVTELAKQKNWSALQIIEHLLDLELEAREKNRIALRFKQSTLFENIFQLKNSIINAFFDRPNTT